MIADVVWGTHWEPGDPPPRHFALGARDIEQHFVTIKGAGVGAEGGAGSAAAIPPRVGGGLARLPATQPTGGAAADDASGKSRPDSSSAGARPGGRAGVHEIGGSGGKGALHAELRTSGAHIVSGYVAKGGAVDVAAMRSRKAKR